MARGHLIPLGPDVPLAEARLTARRLQEAGIPSFLRGEAVALIAADPDRALVRVEVDEEDVEHARRVLAGPPPGAPAPPGSAGTALPEEDGADNGLATVEVFFDSLEAGHAADLLRARGIPCALNGTSEGPLAGLSPGVARLSLEVHECDLERAFEILGFTIGDREEAESEQDEGDGSGQGHFVRLRHPGEDVKSGQGEGDGAVPERNTPAVEHIQEPGSRGPSRLRRHPVQPPGQEAAPAPTPPPADGAGLAPPVVLPGGETGKEGGEASLIVFLFLVAGAVLVLGVLLFS